MRDRIKDREKQLEAWRTVRTLHALKIYSMREISKMAGVSLPTAYNYSRSLEPPNPWGTGRKRYASPPANYGFGERGTIPKDISDLRDRLVVAFMVGDLDEYARCTIALKKRMQELKKKPQPVAALPVKLLEAAE